MTQIKTPPEMLMHWASRFPKQTYLRQSTGDDWIEYSWQDVCDHVLAIAAYIRQQDLAPGSSIVIWSSNSAEWIMADLAIMMSGHVTVPIYPAQDKETAAYILKHCDAKMLFVGPFDQAAALPEILPDGAKTVAIRGANIPCDDTLDAILSKTERADEFSPRPLSDVATIIYSSGTSGQPKGVMHTFQSISETGPLVGQTYSRPFHQAAGDDRERVLSYLPLAHAAERCLVEITSLYINSCVSISAGLEGFASELQDVQPTFFGAVPRIWYKFKEGVEAKLKAAGKSIETDADKAMVRQLLGMGSTASSITGSAPVAPDVHDWYREIGIPLRESYSLTETFSHGTYWDSDEPCQPGCVGRAAKGVEVKLDDQGQIFFKSRSLMKGYYKNEDLTRRAVIDGWFATGDLGRFDADGNLWLTGRVGSVFKSGKGKFIHPEKLEHELNKDPFVEQVMVFGSGRAQPAAVVSLAEPAQGASDSDLQAHFEATRDSLNLALPPYEKIGAMLIVRDAWDADSGELTPTLKIKRRVVEAKYGSQIGARASGVVIADKGAE